MPDDGVLLRRSIVVRSIAPDTTVGWIEDNFHHFGVTIHHADGLVTAVGSATVRYPWSSCGLAGQALDALVSEPMPDRAAQLARQLPMQFQCTHLFEIAALAMSHAARQEPDRFYEMTVRASSQHPEALVAALACDGAEALQWKVAGTTIVAPAADAGQELYRGFHDWLATFPPFTADLVWMLRRAVWLAVGLAHHVQKPIAAQMPQGAVCFTFQPDRRGSGREMVGSRLPAGHLAGNILALRDQVPGEITGSDPARSE